MGRVDDVAVVVLAAGEGTRMRSGVPKVLHPICGRPILGYQLAIARELGAARSVLVVGGSSEQEVRAALATWDMDMNVDVVRQAQALGTAHAVLQTAELLADWPGRVLITYGDHALYRTSTFRRLLEIYGEREADLAFLTADLPDPARYGRVVRGADGGVVRIVEERDANDEIRAISEVNMGVYVASGPKLFEALARVGKDNEKGEYYLTDVVDLVLADGGRIVTHAAKDWRESLGINDRVELAEAERVMRRRICERWLREGVTIVDPDHTYIDADVEIGRDTLLEPGCMLRGATRIGADCRIAAGVVIDSSALGDDCYIKPHCWLEDASLGAHCTIGPSAHLRPDTRLADGVRIGNFVEVKNSVFGPGAKADHLAYVGDADVGSGVTIGCGAITVNYDGEKKSRTVIGDGAFVGCNANLIAPVTVEPRSYVAAGSTITSDVPEGALGVGRGRQRNIEGWRKRRFGADGD
jgi:bifunctional UDP-N-acetylglucosamine pyrophosphorylase/glucosamine-1-phosphate N-acetyltransferase